MTAARLRAAAARLREVAEVATSMGEPWESRRGDLPPNSDFAVTMSPPVALALAELLETLSSTATDEPRLSFHGAAPVPVADVQASLGAVADAVLGDREQVG